MSKVWVPIDLPESARVRDIIVEVGPGGPAHTRRLEPIGPEKPFTDYYEATVNFRDVPPPKSPRFYTNNPSSELNGAPPPEQQRDRWEHHVVAIHPDATTELLRDVLNSYGASHWEIASTVTIGGKCAVVLKRRLP